MDLGLQRPDDALVVVCDEAKECGWRGNDEEKGNDYDEGRESDGGVMESDCEEGRETDYDEGGRESEERGRESESEE